MSSFLLEPNGAVFYLREGADAKEAVGRLEKAYADYSFSNPAEEVSQSIASTLSYVGDVLTGFSFIALSMSALLFFIVMAISMAENASEEGLFAAIGLSKADARRNHYAHCLVYVGLSLASSLAMLLAAIAVAKVYIASSFGGRVVWSLPYRPFLTVIIASMGFAFFVILGIFANQYFKKLKKPL